MSQWVNACCIHVDFQSSQLLSLSTKFTKKIDYINEAWKDRWIYDFISTKPVFNQIYGFLEGKE